MEQVPLKSHSDRSLRIAIAGGNGLVGEALVRALVARGDEVTLLVRDPSRAQHLAALAKLVTWIPAEVASVRAVIETADVVINLAGEPVVGRWTDEKKQAIRRSRVVGTTTLATAIAEAAANHARAPKVLIQASAVGIYPDGDGPFTETSEAGVGFLPGVCVDWENAAKPAKDATRIVFLRIGIVLDRKGGALGKMIPPFKLFAGGPTGSGTQWMSWIHADDVVGLVLFAIDNEQVSGPLNVVGPQPARNRDFAKALGAALGRPAVIPTPKFVLHAMFGEAAVVVLSGQRVLPEKALKLGYVFRYPELFQAVQDAVNRTGAQGEN